MKAKIYDTVSSTMDIAVKHIMEGVEEPIMILAKEQNQGRGREKNTWYSPRGGLYFSFIFPMKEKLTKESITMFHYSTAIGVNKCLRKLYEYDFKIKWPNDIVFESRKISGLLIEYISSSQDFLIIGIGINANNKREEFPENLRNNSDSLIDILGEEVIYGNIIDDLKDQILENSSLTLGNKFESIVEQYNENCAQYMKTVVLENERSYKCEGINILGNLVLKHEDEKKELEIQDSKDIISFH